MHSVSGFIGTSSNCSHNFSIFLSLVCIVQFSVYIAIVFLCRSQATVYTKPLEMYINHWSGLLTSWSRLQKLEMHHDSISYPSSGLLSKIPSLVNFVSISSIWIPIFSGSLLKPAQMTRRPSGVSMRPFILSVLYCIPLKHSAHSADSRVVVSSLSNHEGNAHDEQLDAGNSHTVPKRLIA